MRTYQLTAGQSLVLGVALVAASVALAHSHSARLRRLAPFGHEIGLLALLDALWVYAGTKSLLSDATATRQGVSHSHWVLHVEHRLYLPDERHLINFVAGRPPLAQFCNLYYATMHFAMMGVFLVWLFVRHRASYRSVRTTLALFTAIALLVQLVPVAPPRLMVADGFVDVAARYGQSVYVEFGSWNVAQLSAMPSVHVGWALLIAWATMTLTTSRWRWLGPAHAAMTIVAVVATGNHFWADGIVAAALLVSARYLQVAVRSGPPSRPDAVTPKADLAAVCSR